MFGGYRKTHPRPSGPGWPRTPPIVSIDASRGTDPPCGVLHRSAGTMHRARRFRHRTGHETRLERTAPLAGGADPGVAVHLGDRGTRVPCSCREERPEGGSVRTSSRMDCIPVAIESRIRYQARCGASVLNGKSKAIGNHASLQLGVTCLPVSSCRQCRRTCYG